MTPYNLAHGLYKARQAEHTTIADPGDAGIISVSPTDLNVCIVTGGTTRDLQDATEVPVGVEVLVISQTSTITVESVALADGDFAVFIVTLDSNGARVWSLKSSTDGVAAAAVIPASAGTYEFLATETAADAVDGILTIIAALDAAGLIDGSGITQAV